MKKAKPKTSDIAVIMGSISDWPTMKEACDIIEDFGVTYEKHILSAHRTPDEMREFALNARKKGIKVIIAGAGGAAHLPGMTAAYTTLPVIGVPIISKTLQGIDSLLSIVQMPKGVPVATVAIGNGVNAGLLALQILSTHNSALAKKLDAFRVKQHQDVKATNKKLKD